LHACTPTCITLTLSVGGEWIVAESPKKRKSASRERRLSVNRLLTNAVALTPSDDSTTPENRKVSFNAGIIEPDVTNGVVMLSTQGAAHETQIVTCAMECKYVNTDDYGIYVKYCWWGLAQTLLYVSLHFEMVRAWPGAVFVNTAFTRVCALGVREFLVEFDPDPKLSPKFEVSTPRAELGHRWSQH
jgi:hypothetical protein